MIPFQNTTLWRPLPGTTVQSHRIQGKGAAVTFKDTILDEPHNSFE